MMRTADDLREATGIPFSDEQMACIQAPLAPTVIIAGAGTGKTTVMAARVVWLVGTGAILPEEVLGLTFTRKAAAELGERIRQSLTRAGLGGELDEAREQVSTYDAFAARIVDDHGLRLGLDRTPMMVQGAMRQQLMERVVRKATGPFAELGRFGVPTLVERALKLDGELQSNLIDVAEVRRFTVRARDAFLSAPGHGKKTVKPYKDMLQAAAICTQRLELLELVEQYQQLKRELGVVEYADQLRTAATLVRTLPDIGAELRERYKVVLLDEYQDTSSAQAELLSALFAGHPVTAVGDPYQAIYGWRGAAATNILEFDEAFGQASHFGLTINRRSLTRILDVGNALASTIPGQEGVQLRAPEDTPGGVIEYVAYETADDECNAIADQIVELQGTAAWKDIAVLTRRNSSLAALHRVLTDRGVPVEIVGVGGLLALPEVAPVLATLRLLADPLDNPSLVVLLTSSRWGLSPDDLARLGRRAQDLCAATQEVPCLEEALGHPPTSLSAEGAAVVAQFDAEFRWLRAHATEPIAELVPRIIRTLGVEEELRARGRSTAQLDAFVEACVGLTPIQGELSLAALVTWLGAEERDGIGLEQSVVSDEDSVKLLTVHRSKGLEWEHVFLPSLVKEVFPTKPRGGNWLKEAALLPAPLHGDAHGIPQLAEYTKQAADALSEELRAEHEYAEDRLAYVAATRARCRLVASHHRWAEEVQDERVRSRYGEVLAAEAARTDSVSCRTTDVSENPLLDAADPRPWPRPLPEEAVEVQREAADLVRQACDDAWVLDSGTLPPEVAAQFALWDDSVAHVLAQRDRRTVQLPRGLSTTQLIRLREDRDAFVEELLRRMPRRPTLASSTGTAFHEWLQRRFEASGFDEFEPISADISPLVKAFERGRFADRTPIAVEVPFAMAVGPHQLRGRMDAVFQWEGEFDELVVDWKTGVEQPDELQLAVYRRAWAEARGLSPQRVGAAFYHVRDDRLVVAKAHPSLIEEALRIEKG